MTTTGESKMSKRTPYCRQSRLPGSQHAWVKGSSGRDEKGQWEDIYCRNCGQVLSSKALRDAELERA